MEYLSCSDASKAMGFSVRRIQQMCKNGELPGVFIGYPIAYIGLHIYNDVR